VDLIVRAQTGDEEAYRQLIGPYRRELLVHCYRLLGSTHDAEDALQEALLAAWRGLGGFQERASIRTWLYRIATNQCLKALRSSGRRPRMTTLPAGFDPPEPTQLGEVVWLEPYPDVLLEGLTGIVPGPEARYEAKQAISLAFVSSVQLLPPRQRAVLIMRDVLGFRAVEVAEMLESTEESVTSALKRARATLRLRLSSPEAHQPPPPPNSPVEQDLIGKLTHAFETSDVDGVVALLTDDVRLSMPPLPFEYQGRAAATRFHAAVFRTGRVFRLIPTRANGQPAFGTYLRDPHTEVLHASGLLVLTLEGDRISALTRFDNSVLPFFGLPRNLPH
jgi:RNA polymerase sigma-70 factor (TIGR02960 family)